LFSFCSTVAYAIQLGHSGGSEARPLYDHPSSVELALAQSTAAKGLA
jgi:hypothetical protein